MLKTAATLFTVFLSIPFPAFAQEDGRAAFLGIWGSQAQCAREPIMPGGARQHSPAEIGPEWFQQHGIWCRLRWFDAQARDGGLYVKTRAMCGEDSALGYWLAFDLDTSRAIPELSVIWDDALVNGPMTRCAIIVPE